MGSSYPEFALTKPLSAVSDVRKPNNNSEALLINFFVFSELFLWTLWPPVFLCLCGYNSFDQSRVDRWGIRVLLWNSSMSRYRNPRWNCPQLPNIRYLLNHHIIAIFFFFVNSYYLFISAPEVPTKPSNLHCRITTKPPTNYGLSYKPIVTHNITADCSWKPPTLSDRPIVGYRLIIGRTSETSTFEVDKNSAEIRVLKSSANRLHLHSLLPHTEYLLQLQALSDVGVGSSAQVTLKTPDLSLLTGMKLLL